MPPPMPRATGSRDDTRAALRVLGLAVLTLSVVMSLAPMSWHLATTEPGTRPGLVLLVTSQLACGVALLRRRVMPWLPWLLAALTMTGFFLMLLHHGNSDPVEWGPGYWSVSLMGLAMATLPRRQYIAHAAALVAANCLMQSLLVPLDDWRATVDLVWIAQPILQATLFGDALLMIAASRDKVSRSRSQAQVTAMQTREQTLRQEETSRLLHDHVLHALHGLGRQSSSSTPAAIIEDCRVAVDALSARRSLQPLWRLEDVLTPGLQVTVQGGSSTPLPHPAATALADAVHGITQSLARRRPTSQPTVAVLPHDGGVRVVVDSPGSQTAHLVQAGGPAQEVLDEVGGELAHDGTSLVLDWPRRPSSPRATAWHASPDDRTRRALVHTVWPGLVTALSTAVLAGTYLEETRSLLPLGLLCAAVGFHGTLRMMQGPLSRLLVATLVLLSVVAWGWNLVLAPAGTHEPYHLWLAWVVSSLIHLTVLASTVRVGTLLTIVWTTVQTLGLVAFFPNPHQLASLASTVTTGAGEVAITVLVLAIVRRQAAEVDDAATSARRLNALSARAQQAAHLEDSWSQRVTEEALPLLAAVAEGAVSPGEPHVVDRARALESSLRDELRLGHGHEGLLRQIAGLRSRGWRVDSTLDSEDPPQALAEAARLLALVGDPLPGQGMTVSATTRGASVVVLGSSSPQQQDRWSREVEQAGGVAVVDEDFTRLVLPLPVEAPEPSQREATAQPMGPRASAPSPLGHASTLKTG